MYAIYTTKTFDKEVGKLSLKEQRRIQKIFLQLKENPYVGDQLRIKILREKRIREKRIYYLVFDDIKSVLITAISSKKAQQKTIDYIIKYIDSYKTYLMKIIGDKD